MRSQRKIVFVIGMIVGFAIILAGTICLTNALKRGDGKATLYGVAGIVIGVTADVVCFVGMATPKDKRGRK